MGGVKLSWRGANVLFLGCQSVQFAAEGHMNAFTPLLLRDLGLSGQEIALWTGLLVSIMTAMSLPLAPFWGVLAERFSRRPVVLRGYVLLAGALLIAAWAADVSWLVVARLLMGLCFGTGGVILATHGEITPPNPLRAALALALLMPEPASRVKRGSVLGRTGEVLGLVWTTRPIRWNFFSSFLMRGATSVVDAYLPVRITQLAEDPAAAIGWILGVYGALTTVATWLVGRVVDRTDETVLYWRVPLFAAPVAG